MNIELPIQQTNFDCAVGAAQTASLMLNTPIEYEKIFAQLNPKAKIGTDHEELCAWAKEYLAAKECGENIYKGGLAILNITISQVGHYVLALGKKGSLIRFWCSWVGVVVEVKEDELKWFNGSKTTSKWSLILDAQDYFDKASSITPQKKTLYNQDRFSEIVSYESYEKLVAGLESSTLQNSLVG